MRQLEVNRFDPVALILALRQTVFLSVGNNRGSLALSPGSRTFMPSSRALQLRARSLAVPGFSGGFPVAGLGPVAGIDHSNQLHPQA